MKTYYRVRKAKTLYQVYEGISGETYQGGLNYYQAIKLAKELNK